MTATMVGADWGMAALGINVTSRKAHGSAAHVKGLLRRYGAHAAVTNVSTDMRRVDVVGRRGHLGLGTIETLHVQVQPLAGSVERFGHGTENRFRDRTVDVMSAGSSDLSSRDCLASLEHVQRAGAEALVIVPKRVRSRGDANALHVIRSTLPVCDASSATVPLVRHIVVAKVPVDAN